MDALTIIRVITPDDRAPIQAAPMAMWQRKLKMATDAGHVSDPCSEHGSGQSRSRRFSLWQNGPWEEEEPGAGITSGAWSGAHAPWATGRRPAQGRCQGQSGPASVFFQSWSRRIQEKKLVDRSTHGFRPKTPYILLLVYYCSTTPWLPREHFMRVED